MPALRIVSAKYQPPPLNRAHSGETRTALKNVSSGWGTCSPGTRIGSWPGRWQWVHSRHVTRHRDDGPRGSEIGRRRRLEVVEVVGQPEAVRGRSKLPDLGGREDGVGERGRPQELEEPAVQGGDLGGTQPRGPGQPGQDLRLPAEDAAVLQRVGQGVEVALGVGLGRLGRRQRQPRQQRCHPPVGALAQRGRAGLRPDVPRQQRHRAEAGQEAERLAVRGQHPRHQGRDRADVGEGRVRVDRRQTGGPGQRRQLVVRTRAACGGPARASRPPG